MINVLLADDHTLMRQGLISLLSSDPRISIVAEAKDGKEAIDLAFKHTPDVIILDISMPIINGVEAAKVILSEQKNARILILTMHEDREYILHLVKLGVSGFLVKDSASDELIHAVHHLSLGKRYFGDYATDVIAEQLSRPDINMSDPYGSLTPREKEVFALVVDGLTTKMISTRLGISQKTAENHRGKILDKLSAKNTVDIVRFAAKHNLIK